MAENQIIIPVGFCQCGCGNPTRISQYNRPKLGHIKGQPVRFICGHSSRGVNSHDWKGGRYINKKGYVLVKNPTHPRANIRGYVLEHILVAEVILGKPLPEKAVVHHVNELRSDNRPENLVICQDNAYHKLIHRRMRSYRACGHANWILCNYCGQYDIPENLYIHSKTERGWHRKCHNAYERIAKKRRKHLSTQRS